MIVFSGGVWQTVGGGTKTEGGETKTEGGGGTKTVGGRNKTVEGGTKTVGWGTKTVGENKKIERGIYVCLQDRRRKLTLPLEVQFNLVIHWLFSLMTV